MRKLRLLCSFVVLLCASVQSFAQITSVTFTATPRTGCGQVASAFTAVVVSANPVTYTWDFGDGQTAGPNASPTIAHLYLYSATTPCYTITLTVTDGIETKTFSRTNYICVYKKPTAQFAAAAGNLTTGCAPLTVQLIDQSTASGGTIVSWVWSSQGGTPQTVGNPNSAILPPGIPNPTFTWTSQGSYSPTLTVTDNNGCKETIQKNGFITVTPTPVANFNSPAPNSCTSPHTVTFTNTSVAPAGTTYQWLINGQTFNTTGTQSPPPQTFTTGTYDVQLIAIGAGSTPCRDTLLLPAYINVGGTFNFAYTPNGGCVGSAISFTAPVGSFDQVWDFGDGSAAGVGPQFDHTYLIAGCYTPSLTATLPGGCRTTVLSPTQICISTPPTPTFTVDKVNFCSTPIVVNFTSPAPPDPTMTCAWTFNNTSYLPGPNFSTTCGNQSTINYNPADFVAGVVNPSLVWTDALGCSGTFSLPINYKPLTGVFSLSKVEGCVPYTTNFTGISVPVVFGSANTINWFLDNTPYATGTTPPNFPFPSVTPCTHTFRMEVTNTLGCSFISPNKDIKGGTKPTAVLSFSPVSSCAQFPVIFNVSASSSSPCALDSKMRLSYGDGDIGSTFSTAPISHIYKDTISFCRKRPYLTVYSGGCASDSVQAGCITITPSIAKFEVVKTCTDKTLFNFNATGNTPNTLNSIADACQWQITPNVGVTFETGLSSGPITNVNPAAQAGRVGVRFLNPGTYTVVLTTTHNVTGCTQTASKTIIVANPIPSFTTTNGQGCAPLTVQLTGSTTDPTGVQSSVFSYVQAPPAVAPPSVPVFSAPTALTGGNVVFSSPGAYDNVVLTVTDVNGCTTSSTLGGFQVQGSAVNFTAVPTEGCVPTQVVFTTVVTPFPATATVQNYAWDLKNDGVRYAGAAAGTSVYYEYSSPTATTATYTIGEAGFYQLKHSIITQIPGGGTCKDSITRLAFTGYAPVAVFTAPTTRCTGQPFTVVNTSAGTGLTHTWYEKLDNGTLTPMSYVGATPTITYNMQGTYILCDQVTESTTLACKDSICRQIIVADPIVSFTGTDLIGVCPPLTSILTSTSQNITTLRWEVWPELRDPLGNFIRVKYTDNGMPADIGSSSQNPFSITITEPGCYTVKLFGTTASGCVDSLVQNSYICINGPSADIAIIPTSGCAPLTVTYNITNAIGQNSILYNTLENSQTYLHTTNANVDSQTHTYTTPGTYFPTFLLDDGAGCPILQEPGIPIVVSGGVGSASVIKNNICIGDSAIIAASSPIPNATFQWGLSPDFDSANATDSILTVGPAIPGPHDYTVTITDPNTGCAKIVTVTVFVKNVSLPTVTIAPGTPTICKGSEILISATGVQDGTTITNASGYNWDPLGIGLSQYAAIINPVARPEVTTLYTVTVTGAQGCTATQTVLITIIQPVIPMLDDDRTICKGGSVLLQILSSADVNTPEWSPSNGLSTLFAPTTIANPLTTQVYVLKAKDNNTGCPVRDTITVFVLEPNWVSAGPDKAFCVGSSVTLAGVVPAGTAVGAGGTILWTGPDLVGNNIPDPVVNPTNITTPTCYTIAYTKDLCILEDEVCVRPLDKAAITGTGGSICKNDTLQLNVEGFANFFTWTPANTLTADNIPNPRAFPKETTTYNVTGSLGGNCAVDVIQVTVNVNQLPNLAVSPQNTTFFPKQGLNVKLNVTTDPSNLVNWTSVVVESTPALTLYAHTGSALVLYQPIVPGGPRQSQYVVKATDANSCTNTVVVTLTERTECEDSQIFVPSAFSPNGDGNNDVLYARGSALNGITVFRVFDRWGNLMFETTDIKKGWDGTYQGKLVNPDVYVYYMEAPCSLDGRPIFKKGNVTVVR